MAEEERKKISLETWLKVGFAVSLLVSVVLISLVSLDKETVFSPYEQDPDYFNIQLTEMRANLGDDGTGYTVANTMSTPMLVNDWKDPHRTLLVIAAPEKPFDSAEASAIYDFVTKKGGKVVLASNSTNAQLVASEFGVKYFDAPVVDPFQFYEVADEAGEALNPDERKLWAAASITRDVTQMGDEKHVPCSDTALANAQVDDCRMPVLFHRATAIQVLEDDVDDNREVMVLAHASTPAFIARQDTNIDNLNNPTLGEGKTGLIIRMDFPGIEVLEEQPNNNFGEVDVTGSIVFVSDHSVLANHLWNQTIGEETGKQQCESPLYVSNALGNSHACWDSALFSSDGGEVVWNGNGPYFQALFYDMMEFDNEEITTSVTRDPSEFNLVFDESRHVSSALSSPFTEAIGAVVLLTSDNVLKWLIILNLFALLAIAIMVVPEKENWRHVFDLTRFRERPTKIDSSQYQMRVREAFLSKVRQFNDLTRDEFARKSPAEIMYMVKDPRLVELISSNRSYSNEELREVIPQIRRWGK
ncbi:MAG: hypothetical protein ACPGTT_00275 [Candidatus Poseidoniaceae archaeon]